MSTSQLQKSVTRTALQKEDGSSKLLVTSQPNYLSIDKTERGPQGPKGEAAELQVFEAGSSILSYKPVVLIDGLLHHMDASNISHLHAFAGFSTTSGNVGDQVSIQSSGVLNFTGWGLTQGVFYMAGASGSLVTLMTNEIFSKVIGYAVTSDKLNIIKDNNPIIKNYA